MTGMVQGGWEFVVAAYVVSAVVYVGYVISLWKRLGSTESLESKERNLR